MRLPVRDVPLSRRVTAQGSSFVTAAVLCSHGRSRKARGAGEHVLPLRLRVSLDGGCQFVGLLVFATEQPPGSDSGGISKCTLALRHENGGEVRYAGLT